MKQTAVEWLVDQLFELRNPTLNQIEIIQQAKEMEKQQQRYSEEDMIRFANLYSDIDINDSHLKYFNNLPKFKNK